LGLCKVIHFWYHHGEKLGEAQFDSELEGEEDENDAEFLKDDGESDDEILELIRNCFPTSQLFHGSHRYIRP